MPTTRQEREQQQETLDRISKDITELLTVTQDRFGELNEDSSGGFVDSIGARLSRPITRAFAPLTNIFKSVGSFFSLDTPLLEEREFGTPSVNMDSDEVVSQLRELRKEVVALEPTQATQNVVERIDDEIFERSPLPPSVGESRTVEPREVTVERVGEVVSPGVVNTTAVSEGVSVPTPVVSDPNALKPSIDKNTDANLVVAEALVENANATKELGVRIDDLARNQSQAAPGTPVGRRGGRGTPRNTSTRIGR